MSEHVDDLTKARWEKAKTASDHAPVDALRKAIDEHMRGELSLKHVIVVYASEPEAGKKRDGTGFFQCGPYPTSHVLGLLEYAKGALLEHLLREE